MVFPPHAGVIGEAADGEMGPVRIPPHAGVIGRPGAQENWLNSIPPAYGGYRFPALRRWWSPRTPPHAGVIGRFGFCETGAGRIPPACGGYRGMSENHCESVVYSPSMRGYRHRNRNGGAFVMCPYKQMGLFTIKESYFPG